MEPVTADLGKGGVETLGAATTARARSKRPSVVEKLKRRNGMKGVETVDGVERATRGAGRGRAGGRTAMTEPSGYPTHRRLLTAQEEVLLATRAREGDPEARRLMMEANIRLVMSIARRYTCKSMTFEDLVQEGILGLLEAINKFEVSRGNRFSTYATYWIRQAIVRAIEKQDRMIRLPVYGCDAARRIERTQMVMAESLGRQPSEEEVARETGLPVRLVRTVTQYGQEPLSLDVLVGDSDETVFADLVVDTEASDPADTALDSMERSKLLEQVRALEPREQLVIDKRFGLSDGQMHTLKEIAEQLEMSREGVRHVQLRALRKLKSALGESKTLLAMGA